MFPEAGVVPRSLVDQTGRPTLRASIGRASDLERVAPRVRVASGAELAQVKTFLRPSAPVGRVGLEPTADGL